MVGFLHIMTSEIESLALRLRDHIEVEIATAIDQSIGSGNSSPIADAMREDMLGEVISALMGMLPATSASTFIVDLESLLEKARFHDSRSAIKAFLKGGLDELSLNSPAFNVLEFQHDIKAGTHVKELITCLCDLPSSMPLYSELNVSISHPQEPEEGLLIRGVPETEDSVGELKLFEVNQQVRMADQQVELHAADSVSTLRKRLKLGRKVKVSCVGTISPKFAEHLRLSDRRLQITCDVRDEIDNIRRFANPSEEMLGPLISTSE